jgi:nitroimidazol reductase NimA-like FMN-containing flavoprotein (pyridoxamine 5'-phosphate oxidase superfamily)
VISAGRPNGLAPHEAEAKTTLEILKMSNVPMPLSSTPRTRLRRMKEKGKTDRDDLFAVLRASFVAHLGVIVDGHPMVVPTVYGYDADCVYFHGSVASRSLTTNTEVCLTVTVVDALVLARSVFEHGINYRSAMIYGVPRVVTSSDEKMRALRILTEHAAPGQWAYVRQPSRKELAATALLALPLAEASVKTRTGPPDDGDSPDAALGLWAGELPVAPRWEPPVPDPALGEPAVAVPEHIAALAGQRLDRS